MPRSVPGGEPSQEPQRKLTHPIRVVVYVRTASTSKKVLDVAGDAFHAAIGHFEGNELVAHHSYSRSRGRRVEKSVHVEDRQVTLPEGNVRTLRLYAKGGAVGLGELTDKGELDFVELPRLRTHRNQDASGLFRWYNEYVLLELYGRRPRCWGSYCPR